jgi:TrmH family RNA methyltransferase
MAAASDAIGPRHPEAKRLRALLRDASARRAEGRFVLEGPRLVADALARGAPVEAVYLGLNARRAFASLVGAVEAAGVPVRELRDGVLERLMTTRTPQPVLAVAPIPTSPALDALPAGLVLVTAGVADPGNLGTIVRSAEAAGAVAVVAAGGVDPWNPKVVRSSAGSVLGLPIVSVDDPAQVLADLRGQGRRTIGAAGRAAAVYTAVDLGGPVALVVGSEAHGLPEAVVHALDGVVRIPMAGAVESLNAGVAASVLLFEAARQRNG